MRLAAALALLTAGCATVPEPRADPVGMTYSYVRSDIAGGEEEQVHVRRATADTLIVYKMRERCTRAALVTATIDPVSGEASRLVAAQLLPDARSEDYAELRFDPATRRIEASVTMDGATLRDGVGVSDRPWHLYDYDLATLGVMTAAMTGRPRDFSFGLALVWPRSEPSRFLQWLGRADARFVRAERHDERDAWRFDVKGPAFGTAGGGPMWIDRTTRIPIDVQWGRPNHPGYRDFRLRLRDMRRESDSKWEDRLRAHFAGCPRAG